MSQQYDPNVLPPEVDAFFRSIKPTDRTQLSIEPMDAWVLVAILQFAHRGPLPARFKRFAYSFGSQLITLFPPDVRPYLKAGWNPAHDTPLQDD